MKGAFSALAALLFLSGCETANHPVSALQRFDRMKRDLRWIALASGRVSADARALDQTMQLSNVTGVRAAAVRLKRDGALFSRRAGAAGNATRSLIPETTPGPVRAYLRAVTDTLSAQWVEGVALTAVAELAWNDPLSVRGDDARRLDRDVAWARQASKHAVSAAAHATAVRKSNKSLFRYEISKPTT